MANLHVLAVHTYGSHRVKHPQTGQTVSAYKLGYTSAASAVLLALYRNQAQDVSSRHASYHYVQIRADVNVRHGYILLKVSDDELTRAEAVTIQSHRPAVYRWLDGGWQELPNLRSAHYQPVDRYAGPDFNPTGMQIVSASSGEAEAAVSGITVEKSQRSENDTPWWWIRGDTYPHRDLLKRWGCRWSKRQQGWYFIGQALPEAVQALIDADNPPLADYVDHLELVDHADDAPCTDEEAERILGVKLRPVSEDRPPLPMLPEPQSYPEDEPESPKIRIIKPELDMSDNTEPDAVLTAIRQTKAEALPVLRSSTTTQGRRHLVRIPQSPCGELTGSISGGVWCYGWAVHEGICVYLNMGGPKMAVEAIRAKLSKGDMVSCLQWDAPSVELTAGEGNTGMYTAFAQNIPEAKFSSMILLHEQVIQPNYGGKSTTFILHVSDEQAMAQLHQHVTKLVKVPVFVEWMGYLWQAGQTAMLVRKTRGAGGLDMLAVDLDVDSWSRLITGGLSQGIIRLPH